MTFGEVNNIRIDKGALELVTRDGAKLDDYALRLKTVDDYRFAWAAEDAGERWIAYGDDFDVMVEIHAITPVFLSAIDKKLVDDYKHGDAQHSETKSRLSMFVTACELQNVGVAVSPKPDSEDPDARETFEMLEREKELFQRPVAGPLWQGLRENNPVLYAALVFSLQRQKTIKSTDAACRVLTELAKRGVNVASLRVLRQIDPLRIERAGERKQSAIPSRLLRSLKLLRELTGTKSPSAISAHELPALRRMLADYETFLGEYRRRRSVHFDRMADDDLKAAAGQLPTHPLGTPKIERQVTLTIDAVGRALADELVTRHRLPKTAAASLAKQFMAILFGNVRSLKRPVQLNG